MSDELLDKANALMRRRNAAQAVRTAEASARNAANATPRSAQPEPPAFLTDPRVSNEDFPVLTDIVHVSRDFAPSGEVPSPSADIAAQIEAAVRERLDHLRKEQQAQLSQEIEAWLNLQMPQLVSRAMDGLTDHIIALIAHRVRDELLPRLREISPTDATTAPNTTDR